MRSCHDTNFCSYLTAQQPPPHLKPAGYPPQQVVSAGTFDQGARFDPNKPVSLPVSQLKSNRGITIIIFCDFTYLHAHVHIHTHTPVAPSSWGGAYSSSDCCFSRSISCDVTAEKRCLGWWFWWWLYDFLKQWLQAFTCSGALPIPKFLLYLYR